MNNIVICIPTYKRPIMLEKLILSIIGCNLNKSLIKVVNVIIVDNDIDKTAEITVKKLNERFHDSIKIDYHNYPIKGLSNVRNELLRRAYELNPNYIVFIDDDEFASPEFLNELVKTIIDNDGDMSVGPVLPVFDFKVSRYISCWFERPCYQINTKIKSVATNNLMINVNSLLKYKIWFDNRFNKTGAEDSYFGKQMFKQGATAYWAAKAIVYETIPESRANIKWLSKRFYNGANTYTYILKLERNYLKLFKKIITSFIYIALGVCALVIILIPVKKRYWSLLKLSEGIGSIAGLFSIKYYEYK